MNVLTIFITNVCEMFDKQVDKYFYSLCTFFWCFTWCRLKAVTTTPNKRFGTIQCFVCKTSCFIKQTKTQEQYSFFLEPAVELATWSAVSWKAFFLLGSITFPKLKQIPIWFAFFVNFGLQSQISSPSHNEDVNNFQTVQKLHSSPRWSYCFSSLRVVDRAFYEVDKDPINCICQEKLSYIPNFAYRLWLLRR